MKISKFGVKEILIYKSVSVKDVFVKNATNEVQRWWRTERQCSWLTHRGRRPEKWAGGGVGAGLDEQWDFEYICWWAEEKKIGDTRERRNWWSGSSEELRNVWIPNHVEKTSGLEAVFINLWLEHCLSPGLYAWSVPPPLNWCLTISFSTWPLRMRGEQN